MLSITSCKWGHLTYTILNTYMNVDKRTQIIIVGYAITIYSFIRDSTAIYIGFKANFHSENYP